MSTHGPKDANDPLTDALRALLAPPAGDRYWDSLEGRIMARVTARRAADAGWSTELTAWMRPALVAAAALLLMAGAAMLHSERQQQRRTYESLLAATPLPAEAAVRPSLQNERDATLRFLLAP